MVRSTNVEAVGEDMGSREGGLCVGRVEDVDEAVEIEERWSDV